MAERAHGANAAGRDPLLPDRALRHAPVPAARIDFSADDRRWIAPGSRRSWRRRSPRASSRWVRTARSRGRIRAPLHGRHAVAVSSGTAALEIILRALGVEGARSIVPANTFFATAAAAVHAGARRASSTAIPETMALDPPISSARLRPRPRRCHRAHRRARSRPRSPALAELCRAAGVSLVEDAAHAHGSASTAQPAGTFGIAGAFSFYPTKVMTGGEGGMIVTDDERSPRGPHLPRPGQGLVPRERPHADGVNWR